MISFFDHEASLPPSLKKRIRWVQRSVRKRFPFLRGCAHLHFVGPATMQQLNRDFRHRDRPTNVLSFPTEELSTILWRFPQLKKMFGSAPLGRVKPLKPVSAGRELEWGDIFLCRSVIRREARSLGEIPEHRCVQLVIHGCLHLLGFDHHREDDAKVMERLEDQLFEDLC